MSDKLQMMVRSGVSIAVEKTEIGHMRKCGFVLADESGVAIEGVLKDEAPKKTFDDLKVDELKKLAEQFNIDLGESKLKDEIKESILNAGFTIELLNTAIAVL